MGDLLHFLVFIAVIVAIGIYIGYKE